MHACVHWGGLTRTAVLESHLSAPCKFSTRNIPSLCPWKHKRMYTASLFVVVKMWKPSRCLSLVEWVSEGLYMPTMEHSAAVKIYKLSSVRSSKTKAHTFIKQCYLFFKNLKIVNFRDITLSYMN